MANGMDVDLSSDINFDCEPCIMAKQSRRPFPEVSKTQYNNIGDLVCSNIWGPARVESLQRNTYYISFSDAASRHVHVDFLKSRAAALDRFRKYNLALENQTGKRIKILRVDNVKEYVQGAFRPYLESRGIILQTTSPYSPAQNGIAECLNRTLVEHARAMLLAHDAPRFLWQEAVAYACYLKNRSPTRALANKTPYEVFWGKRPDFQDIQEFGVPCWVLVPDSRKNKLEAKSEKYTFVGLNEHGTGWRYYVPALRQVLTSRNVVFIRQKEYHLPISDGASPNLEEEHSRSPSLSPKTAPTSPKSGSVSPPLSLPPPAPKSEPTTGKIELATESKSESTAARHSSRTLSRPDYKAMNNPRLPTKSGSTSKAPRSQSRSDLDANLCFTAFNPHDEPRSLKEVQEREDWPEWKEAMDKEMDQLKKMGTYELVDLPEGRKAVGCRWVYLIKRNMEGAVQKYKARLVAQGFSQMPGQDFFETYALVMRLESFRTLLAIAATKDWSIHQMDVVGAYLNSHLEEEIYMRQPPSFDDGTGCVYRLIKGLYGLRQAGRAWYKRLNHVLVKILEFTRLDADYCVYIRLIGDHMFQILIVHVDDMALFATNDELMVQLKEELGPHFSLTDLGELRTFVGLQII